MIKQCYKHEIILQQMLHFKMQNSANVKYQMQNKDRKEEILKL